MPVSAEKLSGPYCPPSLDAFCLVIQQIPAHFTGTDPTGSTYLLFLQELSGFALLSLSLAIRIVSAFFLSTSLVIYSSSTAPCTLTIMTMKIFSALSTGDTFSPTPGYSNAKKSMLLNWEEEPVTQVILQHYFSLSLTEVTLSFNADAHASGSMHKVYPGHKQFGLVYIDHYF